jgi:hypothetical protein
MLDKAHPKGGFDLDVDAEGHLARVEDLVEVHEQMLDAAHSTPKASAKVKKAAADIHKMVSEGKLAKEDVDSLVAHGVDPEAVKYYKELFNADAETKAFATELTKEHVKAQVEEEMGKYRTKIARAYEMAYDMVSRDLLADEKGAVNSQVDQIMKWNDEAFDSMKRVIARHAPKSLRKQASSLPVVGLINNGEGSKSENLVDELSSALFGSKRSMF